MSDIKDPRVLFAAERTLLAWNRTSLSLIAFGFVAERASLLIKAISPTTVNSTQLAMTFWLGIAFIALGSFTSAFSARQYSVTLRTLGPEEFPKNYAARWGIIINGIVATLGTLLITCLIVWHVG